jgi:stage V sporulation protein R
MIDEIANHGNRIRRYMDRFGVDDVECFIDVCLSIEDLIDIHSPFVKRHDDVPRYEFPEHADDEPESTPPTRFRSKGYMDRFINPPEALAAEVRQNVEKQRKREQRFPSEPVRDVMLFFLEHAPLKSWQRDILSIIRDEAYYFAPQAQTKIMNEGWATYWHSTIMTRHGIEPADLICYADHCSGTLASSQTKLNPYKLGLELFRHVEQRWNKGQFGEAWEQCDDMRQKHDWDTKTMLGREKIFEVRRIHNDLTFIDEFLTLDFCREHKLFSFGFNQHSGFYEIESRQFAEIKQRLLFNLTNVGRPIIRVIDANHMNRGELFLQHRYSGVELKASYAADTLANVYRLWNRPVHIETVLDDKATILSFDGSEHTSTETDELIEIGD